MTRYTATYESRENFRLPYGCRLGPENVGMFTVHLVVFAPKGWNLIDAEKYMCGAWAMCMQMPVWLRKKK